MTVEKCGINPLVYDFDVIEFAKNIINEIDNVRSYTKSVDENTKDNLQLPIESRVNAFFRLIGLPMFVKIDVLTELKGSKIKPGDPILLSPGYDSLRGLDIANLQISDTTQVIFNVEVGKLLSFREFKLATERNKIGTDITKNKDMALALQYPIPLQSNLPVETNYGMFATSNGIFSTFSEGQFNSKDANTNSEDTENTSRNVFKKLQPLITSYLPKGVYPTSKQLARPFLNDSKRYTLDNMESPLPKPFIETICLIRLTTLAENTTSEESKENEYVSNIKAVLGEDLYNFEFGQNINNFNILEQFIIDKLLSSAKQLADRYIELERLIQDNLGKGQKFKISITSSSSQQSPFGKRADIESNVEVLQKIKDEQGNAITVSERKKRLEAAIQKDEALISLFPSADIINKNDQIATQSVTKNISYSALTNSFISMLTQDMEENKKKLNSLNENQKNIAKSIDKMRLELDMLTGEFCEISMVDVIAVLTGLFLISKDDLVKLLDDEARANLANDPRIVAATTRATSAQTNSSATAVEFPTIVEPKHAMLALQNLEFEVDFFYLLVNSLIEASRHDRESSRVKTDRKPKSNPIRKHDFKNK